MVSRKQIRRLRLREGDIIVVKDLETELALLQTKIKIPWPIPVVFAPNGIHRLSKEYLKKLLEK